MANEDGSIWIVFNGEIFNYIELRDALIRKGHRFLTRSPTPKSSCTSTKSTARMPSA